VPLTDEELLQAIIDDDPGAFDEFVDRYGRRLMAFSVRTCTNVENAEDVFQETLLTAYHAQLGVGPSGGGDGHVSGQVSA